LHAFKGLSTLMAILNFSITYAYYSNAVFAELNLYRGARVIFFIRGIVLLLITPLILCCRRRSDKKPTLTEDATEEQQQTKSKG